MLRRTVLFAAKLWMCALTFMPFLGLSQQVGPARTHTGKADVSINLTGYLPTSSVNNGVHEKGSDAVGVTGAFRYSFARYAAFEFNYGHARTTEDFTSTAMRSTVHTGVHEVTGAYVLNLPTHNRMQGFVLGGAGTLQFNPITKGTTIAGTQSQSKPTLLLGAGVNYRLSPHVALRLQYRSLLYALPSFKVEALRTNGFQAASEPSLGVVYRF
ncbi:MAG TPA: outer membrane beta-barrel protein [Acidisarcina sp.]